MDLIKSQRLLVKIQAFLENATGNELSRLEKDLIKSYIQQLYEAVSEDETEVVKESKKQPEILTPKVQKFEPTPIPVIEVKQEIEKVVIPEIPKPVFEVREPVVEHKSIQPVEIPVKPEVQPVVHVKEVVTPTYTSEKGKLSEDVRKSLQQLFDASIQDDSRFGHVQIANIEAALGINDRIFTLNGLFGGDKALFEATCTALNDLRSFDEATDLLIHGPAGHYNWVDPEKVKMAEHFIRIVSRRYPKA
jgi:hypothetical protein